MNTTIGTPTGRHTRHEGISAMSVDPSVRIGDAEREHVVAALGQHLSVGRLTMSEFESRLDTVYAARTRGELDAVLADLPTTAPPPPHPPPPRLVPSTGRPWTAWALAGGISLLIWVTTSFAQGHPLYFWPIWVIGPWGVVLLAQAVLARPRLSIRSTLDEGDACRR